MSSAWRALDEEIAKWRNAGRQVEFWWRDDDAARPTPALARLLSLSAHTGVPLALAVVPLGADSALLGDSAARVSVIQHGGDHRNRAASDEKKTEFPEYEAAEVAFDRLGAGRMRLAELAGPRFVPVLAPPWNRFPESLARGLAQRGFIGLSRYGARTSVESAPGLRQVNTHVDVIAWKAGRGFIGEDGALRAAIGHLAARRRGDSDPDEPTGWLTHHVLHDDPAWDFLGRLLATTRSIPGVAWRSAEELFHVS